VSALHTPVIAKADVVTAYGWGQDALWTGLMSGRTAIRAGQPEALPAPGPLLDAQRAVRLVRSRAAQWGIDPNRIGILGFSAGGHLAVATATHFDERQYEPIDELDNVSCRPDFMILVYPVITMGENRKHVADNDLRRIVERVRGGQIVVPVV